MNKDFTTARVRIHWKDGRSEVRTIKSSELNDWERKVGKGYVSKVEQLKESKFEKYLLEAEVEQRYKSSKTSINANKLPATFGKLEKLGVVKPGMVIADIGGGKFDNAINWASQRDSHLYIVDPHNRTPDYNEVSISNITKNGADIVTINNVLNVIQEEDIRLDVIKQAFSYLKPDGKCFILIYEGNGSGIGKETLGGESWQNNMKTDEYLGEVRKIFPEVRKVAGMIVASKS